MLNGDIRKENKTKKNVTPVNFSNLWTGSLYKKYYTWKKNHEAQFLENKTLKLKNKYIKKIKIKNNN